MGQRRRHACGAGQTEEVIHRECPDVLARLVQLARNTQLDARSGGADGSLYTGITNDVSRRVQKHNAGKASRYTRSRLPVVLVYQEPQSNRSWALKRELAIKAILREGKESLIRAADRR
jgi:predicted GIY-YIG superfamily endonuclease